MSREICCNAYILKWKEPQIVAALKEKDSIFDRIIPHIKGIGIINLIIQKFTKMMLMMNLFKCFEN